MMPMYAVLFLALLQACFLHINAGKAKINDEDPSAEVRSLFVKVKGSARKYVKACHSEELPELTPFKYTMDVMGTTKRYYVKIEEKLASGMRPVVKITKKEKGNAIFSGVSMQKEDDTICYIKDTGCPYRVTCRG